MAKRFTDTEIWDQDWFVDLPPKYKLFFYYIKDRCDNAGIWRPNKVIAQRIIGEPINLQEFIDFVNTDKKRIEVLPSGRWFIREFFLFQYGEVFSPTSRVHLGAMKILAANGIHISGILNGGTGKLHNIDNETLKKIAYSKDMGRLLLAYEKGIDSPKDKDKDKNKDKDKDKE